MDSIENKLTGQAVLAVSQLPHSLDLEVKQMERECGMLEKLIDVYGWREYLRSVYGETGNEVSKQLPTQLYSRVSCVRLGFENKLIEENRKKENMNAVTLIGYIGTEPESQSVGENGMKVTKFRMATRGYNTKTKQSESDWHNIVIFGKEALVDKLTKGTLVGIQGRIKTETWTGQDGQKKSKTVIIANDVQLYGSRGEGHASSAAAAGEHAHADSGRPGSSEELEDIVPF